jgi:hypothetical protein
MNFEFLAAYRKMTDIDIESVLAELLTKVLNENLNDFEAGTVRGMIQFRHQRPGGKSEEEDGNASSQMLLGFTLVLPEETEQLQTVVDDFAAELAETPPIFHVVKFEDPLLRATLQQRAEQIFALEMKLRRVLTIIYLHACQRPDPYDLLRDESVKPTMKEQPDPEQMKARSENQFFYLTFGQYVDLNQRREFKLPTLLRVIQDQKSYDEFRAELVRSPIAHEDDADVLAGIRERMDSIEKMRNCVAHNRKPGPRDSENFQRAAPLLDGLLDEYLAKWDYWKQSVAATPAQEDPACPIHDGAGEADQP